MIAFAAVRTTRTRRRRTRLHPEGSTRLPATGTLKAPMPGTSWRSPEDGLKPLYLVSVAVDPADPDTVIVSATDGPGSAYLPR